MGLPEFAIRRPVTITVLCLLAILLGAIAFVKIPVDLLPETVYPTISVRAEYPGVGPEEMETLVARPLEAAFAAAPGVEEIFSTCVEGSAMVRVGFTYGTNLDEAANELRSRLDRRRRDLPEDMDPPTMFKFDLSQFPIMFLTVSASDMDLRELRDFAEKTLQPRFERVPGVAQFTIRGGLRREIHVDLNLAKLQALDLPVAQVVEVVRRENLNEPVGPVREGRYEILLRTKGEFENLDQIRNLVLTTRQGVPVYLRDVALVEDSHEEVRQLVTMGGKPAVRMFVNKQSGSNTVKVSEAVWQEVERVHRDYPDIQIASNGDSAEFIKAAVRNVRQSAWQGAVLAVLVLLFFLASFSSAVIIGIAIPVSVISTFALMYFNGFTLNTVSFGGLALGVGMLVDNAIVVLENIVRHREAGQNARESAIVGSREVSTAITASTLTTIAVFVPVVFLQGVSMITFQQLAYVVSFSLLCSLAAALTIVPLLSSRYLHVGRGADGAQTIFGRLFRFSAQAVEKVSGQYGRSVAWCLGHRMVVLGSAAALFVVSLYLMPLIGVELQPEVDEGDMRVTVELEPGTRVEVTDEIMQRVSQVVRDNVPEAIAVMTESGGGGGGGMPGSGQNTGEVRIRLVDRKQRSRSAAEIAADLRPMLQIEPAMVVRTQISSGMHRRATASGAQGGDRLAVEVRGYDLKGLQELAVKVQEAMAAIPGVVDVQTSRRPGVPEMVVEVDRDKASSLGLNVSDVANTFRTAVGGRPSSMYRDQGDQYNILIRLQESDRLSIGQVGSVALTTPAGRTISAESVVHLRRQEGPVSIERHDQQRVIVVSGNPDGRDLGSIVHDLDGVLAQIDRPEGYEFSYGGEYEDQQKSFQELTFAVILAIVLVYMVMAAQFESWLHPFIVLFSIPLASIGIVLMLLLTNTTFNIQGFMGVIILVGIVVNNAIVLIDYTNLLRREHNVALHEAVVTSGARRLRPILMTTITTVLGLVPMALGIGEGGELQAPLARVVIGGLMTSTLITLVVIPVIYSLVEERREPAPVARLEPAVEPAAGD